jgi:uracil-DNA glycosylase
MNNLLQDISQCTICKSHLPLGPNPIVSTHPRSKIVLLSQAPGRLAHENSKAWDDPSGKQLRKWLGVDEFTFYNPQNFAILPIGFCYPGKAKTGDLPPRPECAPKWHKPLLEKMTKVELVILIGAYAQNYYLDDKKSLTERVADYKSYLPKYFPIPHPSPTNRFWRSKNPWFEKTVISELSKSVKSIIKL